MECQCSEIEYAYNIYNYALMGHQRFFGVSNISSKKVGHQGIIITDKRYI